MSPLEDIPQLIEDTINDAVISGEATLKALQRTKAQVQKILDIAKELVTEGKSYEATGVLFYEAKKLYQRAARFGYGIAKVCLSDLSEERLQKGLECETQGEIKTAISCYEFCASLGNKEAIERLSVLQMKEVSNASTDPSTSHKKKTF